MSYPHQEVLCQKWEEGNGSKMLTEQRNESDSVSRWVPEKIFIAVNLMSTSEKQLGCTESRYVCIVTY